MYKAVLFDLFGTLIDSPSMTVNRQMVRDVAEILKIPYELFIDPWMSINDGRLDGSFGSSEGDILAAAELVGVGVSDSQMAQCMEVRRSSTRVFMTPKPGVLDMLGELREIGWILGLITDCVYDVPAVWPESRFALHFSCVTHIRKPDSRAYLSFLDTLNVRPEDALFVGDGGSDGLNGAVRAGIDGLMIDDNPTPAEQMLKVGVGEWSGPVITSMSHLTSYARNRR